MISKHIIKALPLLLMLSQTGISQDINDELDILLTELSHSGTGGVVLATRNGQVEYEKSFGKASLELDVDMTTANIFRIGSITKQFTAAAILRLQQEGKLSVTDNIARYISDYPSPGNQVTIEQLLTHSSGIANYTSLDQFDDLVRRTDFDPLELIDFFKDEPMDFAPGEGFNYSNSGYIILGYIIEVVSGMPYAEYLQRSFFTPLGLKSTLYDNHSRIITGRVQGYQKTADGHQNADFLSMTVPYAGGSLLSTAGDLNKWITGLVKGDILNEQSLEILFTNHTLSNGRQINYGYGWRIGNIQGSKSIKHGGTVNGFTSYAIYMPADRLLVTILTNCECNQSLEIVASKMIALMMGNPFQYDSLVLNRKQLRKFQGVYQSETRELKTIRLENDTLVMFAAGRNKSILLPVKQDELLLIANLTLLDFSTNKRNNFDSFSGKGLDGEVQWVRVDSDIESYARQEVTPAQLEEFQGLYQLENDRVIEILVEEDRIYGQMGSNREEIIPYATNKFFAKDIDAELIFMREDDQIIELRIKQNGERIGVKIE